MLLRYINAEGKQVEIEMGTKAILIGRSQDADVPLGDEKSSRLHCEIRMWDGDFIVKDLKSRNGTYVNERRIDVTILRAGDKLRVGNTVFDIERKSVKGTTTLLTEVSREMEEGKGYRTILREIVQCADEKPKTKKADG